MSSLAVPFNNPKPDIGRFLDAMDGRIAPDRPPFVEYYANAPIMRAILDRVGVGPWVDADLGPVVEGTLHNDHPGRASVDALLDNTIDFWHRMGYDYVRIEFALPLPSHSGGATDTSAGGDDKRHWQSLGKGPITTWEEFEDYPWPEVTDGQFYAHEYVCAHLPEGMGFFSCHGGGLYEHVSRLMGYECLCLSLYRNPELVAAVTDRVGAMLLDYNRRLVEFDHLTGIFQGDDMGFNTQTLLPPKVLRKYFLPWHKRYASLAHEHGKRYYLHSCGDISAIMPDLIDDVGIDGKHSYQDGVFEITDAKDRYGDRICLLGGVDMHKLSTYSPEDLRKYVRRIIDKCLPGGRFAIGAGNSIPEYVPLENYLTMLDEALR